MATVSVDRLNTKEPNHKTESKSEPFVSTRNACRLCAPLGACLAFRGVEGAVPFLHGSQGCSTYIRRYMISHFKEPMDIACSNFGETTAIFGGKQNLRIGLENVVRQYKPQMIGIATTCLAETIGDDVSLYLIKSTRNYPTFIYRRWCMLQHPATPAATPTVFVQPFWPLSINSLKAAWTKVMRPITQSTSSPAWSHRPTSVTSTN